MSVQERKIDSLVLRQEQYQGLLSANLIIDINAFSDSSRAVFSL